MSKALPLALIFSVVSSSAEASEFAQQSDLDHVWTMVAAALVLLMQGGFLLLEAGQVRAKNAVNVAQKNVLDFVLSAVAFGLIGFAMMFGASAGGFVGWSSELAFFNTQEDWSLTFFVFQVVFCGTAATIVSGAVAERMRMSGYIVCTLSIAVIIYPVSGHWAWGGLLNGSDEPWLAGMGFMDFAGSTVVHSVGAWVGLAGAIVLGARDGKFDENGKARTLHGHSPVLATMGTVVLWVGWIGFNGGSTTSGTGAFASIVANTVVAGSVGGVAGFLLGVVHQGYNRPEFILNGSLAGLVGITAGCDAVSLQSAAIIGLLASVAAYAFREALEAWAKIDDPLGAVAVHGAAGAVGTILTGVFAAPDMLLAGSRGEQIVVQFIGVGAIFAWSFGISFAVLAAANKLLPDPDGRGRGLRIPREAEEIGMNVTEHRAPLGIYGLVKSMAVIANNPEADVEPIVVDAGDESAEAAILFNKIMDHIKLRRQAERDSSASAEEIEAFQTEISNVLSAMADGNFSQRMEIDDTPSLFHPSVNAINVLSKSVGDALLGVNRVLTCMANGDLDARIRGEFGGIIGEMKEAVNGSLDQVSGVMRSVEVAVEAAAQGDFSVDVPSESHKGYLATLCFGITKINTSARLGLDDVSKTLSAFAKGDLTAKVSSEHQGAFAAIGEGITNTSDTLSMVVTDIVDSAEKVGGSIADISQNAEHLDKIVNENASVAKALSSDMGELKAEIEQNEARLADVQRVMREIRESSEEAKGISKEALSRIEEVDATVRNIAASVGDIEDIAMKTNLLSLNASVEAARASGEVGAGFGVVAQEVRALANSSTASAAGISTKLAEVTSAVEVAVNAIGRTDASLHNIDSAIQMATRETSELIESSKAAAANLSSFDQRLRVVTSQASSAAVKVAETVKSAKAVAKSSETTLEKLAHFSVTKAKSSKTLDDAA